MDLASWARDIAESHLSKPLPRRWSHVQAVAARATEIAPHVIPRSDRELLVAAAWLHDVGYAPDLAETGFHPLDGARFLRAIGVEERVCRLVAHHSAAVVEAELRGLAGQLAEEFEREVSPVADALWYCDLTTGPDGQRFSAQERFAEIRCRYGPGHLVTEFIARAEPALTAAVQHTEERLAAARAV